MKTIMRLAVPLARSISHPSPSCSSSFLAAKSIPRPLLLSPAPATFSASPTPSSSYLHAYSPLFARYASTGTGQGGRVEKDAAAEKKKEKERLAKAKAKEKEKALKAKEKEKAKAKASKIKEKEKEKEKALKLKEKEKLQASKDKAKAKTLTEDGKPKPTRRKGSALHPPKQIRNPWQLFLIEFIERERTTSTEAVKATEYARLAAPAYKELSAEERATLLERVEAEKAKYAAAYEEWKKKLTPEMIKEENRVRAANRSAGKSNKKNLKVEGQPLGHKNAYMYFMQAVRRGELGEIYPEDAALIDQTKLAASHWRTLSDEDKAPYTKLAAEDLERYNEEKKVFDEAQAKKIAS